MVPRETAPPVAAAREPLPDLSAFQRPSLPELGEGRYRVRFAEDARDLERVLRLRFEVFNLELSEGLESSYRTGLDLDPFDFACDHLMVIEESTGQLVGTYRMQSAARLTNAADGASAIERLYCAQEFDLHGMPPEVLRDSVELGRACIVHSHRNGHVLFALWRGLAAYCTWNRRRYLFGCCSLTSQDTAEGRAFERYLVRSGKMHPALCVLPHAHVACGEAGESMQDEPDPKVPTLFGTYLRYGALACGPPAIDREFKTIDFLVLLDLASLDLRVRRLFFADIPAHDMSSHDLGSAGRGGGTARGRGARRDGPRPTFGGGDGSRGGS